MEILHSEQILSKKFDKRLQFRYRSVNFKICLQLNIVNIVKTCYKTIQNSDRPANIVNSWVLQQCFRELVIQQFSVHQPYRVD